MENRTEHDEHAVVVALTAVGVWAKVAGSGVGGSVSKSGVVDALAGAEAVPVLPRLSRMVTV